MKRIGEFLAFDEEELIQVNPSYGAEDRETTTYTPLVETRIRIGTIAAYRSISQLGGVGFFVRGGLGDQWYHWAVDEVDALSRFDAVVAGGAVSPDNLSALLQMLQRVLVQLDVKQETP